MSEETPGPWRRFLSIPVEIVVAIYVVIDGIVSPLFRPAMRLLSSLKLIQRLEQAIGRMPPYLILVALVVPFGIAELTKVFAVVMMAEDHFRLGMTLFIGAYVVSILVCERTFHAGKGQLMKIGWFKVAYDWLMAIKDHVMGWFKRTRVWAFATDLKAKIRVALRNMRQRLLETFGVKARGSLERP